MSLLDLLREVTVGPANEEPPLDDAGTRDGRDSADLLDEITAVEFVLAA